MEINMTTFLSTFVYSDERFLREFVGEINDLIVDISLNADKRIRDPLKKRKGNAFGKLLETFSILLKNTEIREINSTINI